MYPVNPGSQESGYDEHQYAPELWQLSEEFPMFQQAFILQILTDLAGDYLPVWHKLEVGCVSTIQCSTAFVINVQASNMQRCIQISTLCDWIQLVLYCISKSLHTN